MTRQWAYGMALLLGLTTAGLAQAWQPPAADMVAGMLPPAPPGYEVQVMPIGLPGIIMVDAAYTSLGSNDTMNITIIGMIGPFDEPPGTGEPLPPEPPGTGEPLPPSCTPDVYVSSQGQRQGFPELRIAMADACPPEHIIYFIDIPFHEGNDYFYLITAMRYAPPPFRAEDFQPLDALLDQIDLPALAALGG